MSITALINESENKSIAQERVTIICSKLLQMFENGSFPPAVARTVILRVKDDNKPSDNWSILNQIIMLIHETDDARGFKQWQLANRRVKAGAQAFYIMAPMLKRIKKTVVEGGYEREDEMLIVKGFRMVPVFRKQDTDGPPLPEVNYNPPDLPPLYDVAQHFGVVNYRPYQNRELGSCSQTGQIRLYSQDIDVFFHELGHQVHNTICPLKGGQHVEQELVAEMTACFLCELYDYQGYIWHGWRYMQAYTSEEPTKTLKAIAEVLDDVKAVVLKIITVQLELNKDNTSA